MLGTGPQMGCGGGKGLLAESKNGDIFVKPLKGLGRRLSCSDFLFYEAKKLLTGKL